MGVICSLVGDLCCLSAAVFLLVESACRMMHCERSARNLFQRGIDDEGELCGADAAVRDMLYVPCLCNGEKACLESGILYGCQVDLCVERSSFKSQH